jgi:hypothetical protein
MLYAGKYLSEAVNVQIMVMVIPLGETLFALVSINKIGQFWIKDLRVEIEC